MASPPSQLYASRERRLNVDNPRGGHPGISLALDPSGKILLKGVPADTPNYGRFRDGDVIISVDNNPVGGCSVQQVPRANIDAENKSSQCFCVSPSLPFSWIQTVA